MAEELTGLGADASTVVSGGDNVSVSTPVETQAEVAEKMLPQSQVGKLISQNRAEYYQKGKAEALAELNASNSMAKPDNNAQDLANNQQGQQAQPAKTVDQIVEEKVNERLAQNTHAAQHQHAMQTFVQKMEDGPKLYPDFEEKVAQLNLPSLLPLVHLANTVDNAAAVVYHFAGNVDQINQLYSYLQNNTPQLAVMKIKELSDSIKRNQAAAKQPKTEEPLSQVKPSNVSADSGSTSIGALKRSKDYLRG